MRPVACIALLTFFCAFVGAFECSEAIQVAVPGTVTGSTSIEPLSTFDTDCVTGATEGYTAWYKINPTPGSYITINTCGSCMDTTLTVFSSGCQGQTCVVANDDAVVSCPSGYGYCSYLNVFLSSVSFCASENEYLILVKGFYDDFGDFELNIINGGTCQIPSNNNCGSSQLISSFPQTISFNNEFATGGLNDCGNVDESGHSLWYRVSGTGGSIIAHTCDAGTKFDTAISVFSGTCGSLTCTSSNDQNFVLCPSGLSYVEWCTEAGTDYFLYVTGIDDDFGNGVLTISSGEPTCDFGVGDGRCQSPNIIDLSLGFFELEGTTVVDSVNAVDKPRCDTSDTSKDTVEWFYLKGNGHSIYMDTCGSDFDTIINIFKGSCYNLECVLWSDDNCGLQSSITFCAEDGVDYLIGVGGFGLSTGDYDFYAFDQGECVQQASCEDVVDVLFAPHYTNGNLAILDSVTLPVEPCGFAPLGTKNAWFSTVGYDETYYVDTCGSCFDTVLTIYEALDGCDEMRCVAYNDDHNGECTGVSYNQCSQNLNSAISFCAGSTSTYYILVGGYNGDTGLLTLNLDYGGSCLPNDDCELAIPLEFDVPIIVDTSFGYNQLYKVCNEQFEGYGSAWYMMDGTGSLYTVDIAGTLYTDVIIITSDSGSCETGQQICLEGEVLVSGESMEFCTTPGVTYWISIGGEFDYGEFIFTVSVSGGCIDTENQICQNSIFTDVSLSNAVFSGNTEFSGGELYDFTCNGVNFDPPSYSWYHVEGNGRLVSASTCNSDYDTVLGVIEQSCDFTACVTANDDSCGTQSSVEFCALTGADYYIIVGGYNAAFGNFELLIEETNRCTDSDVCSQAEGVTIPTSIFGSNLVGATVDILFNEVPLNCVASSLGNSFVNTQWYSFSSTEARIIEIWGGYSSINVVLGVYETNCAISLSTCVTDLTADSVSYLQKICGDFRGERYLMVAGENDSRGNYEIDINYLDETCSLSSQIHSCPAANEIESIPHTTFGDTRDGTPFFAYVCEEDFYTPSTIMAGNTWFSVPGNGYNIQISACNSPPELGLGFVVFGDCLGDSCIASSNDSCFTSWCGVPGETYYIKMGSYGQHSSGDYEVSLTNLDVCVDVPNNVFAFTLDKDTTSITFGWVPPFAYGYPIINYSYEVWIGYTQFIPLTNTTETSVTLSNLDPNTQYDFYMFATSQWGSGNYILVSDRTTTGSCLMNTIPVGEGFYQNENIYDLHFRGHLIEPTVDAVIHSVDLNIGSVEVNGFAYMYLFENDYSLGDHFTLKDWRGYVFYGPNQQYEKFEFSNLEWTLCSNKKYILASIVNGQIITSDPTVPITSSTSCIGEYYGVSIDAFFLNAFRESLWYDDIVRNELIYQMVVDATITTPVNGLPSTPVIKDYYATVTSATIQWRESCSIAPITGYSVQINPHFQEVIVDADELEMTFSGLSGDAVYNIQIRALNSFGASEPLVQEIRTLSDRYSIQWLEQSSDSSGFITPTGTAIDADGNTYVSGYFDNASYFGGIKLQAELFVTDGFLVKYSPNAVPLWAVHIGRTNDAYAFCNGVSVGTDGNPVVIGTFLTEVTLADGEEPIRANIIGTENVFVAKYSSDGQLLFSKHMGDPIGFDHSGNDITVDGDNRIIATGQFHGSYKLVFYEDNEYELNGIGDTDAFVAVWGGNGIFQKAVPISAQTDNDNVYGTAVTTDEDRNIYVVANYDKEVVAGNLYLNTFGENFLIAKYSLDLDIVWLHAIGGDLAFGTDIDVSLVQKTVAVSGEHFSEPLYYFDAVSDTNTPSDATELVNNQFLINGPVVLGLDPDTGSIAWLNTISVVTLTGSANGVTITDGGFVVTTGNYLGELIFSPEYRGIQFPKTQFETIFFVGIEIATGDLSWARWAGNQFYSQVGTAITSSGNLVAATGYFDGSASFDCSQTVTSVNAQEAFITNLLPSTETTPMYSPPEVFDCGAAFMYERTGSITFPQDASSAYPNNFECYWLIEVEDVPHIMGFLKHFDFADASDSLTFYDGSTVAAPVLHYYNGENAVVNTDAVSFYDNYYNKFEVQIQSTGPSMLIHFKTGSCFRGFGFAFEYESAHEASFCDPEFEQVLTLKSGLVSQRQKGGYKDSSDCYFFVKPPSSNFVLIEFLQFDLADSDYIEFFDESGPEVILLAKFYGNDYVYPIQSIGDEMTVHFVSDGKLYDKGFILQYRGIEDPVYCEPYIQITEGTGTVVSHTAEGNYLPSASCSWNITADTTMYDGIYMYFNEYEVPYPGHVDLTLGENNKQSVSGIGELYISETVNMIVEFKAEGTIATGFIGDYCAHPKTGACDGKTFTESVATFDNHFCGQYYEANSFCEWVFAPTTTSVNYLMFTFPLIDFVNDNPSTPTDFIDVLSGPTNGPFIPIAKISHSKVVADPPTFITTDAAMKVIFQSDATRSGEGFEVVACASHAGSGECSGIQGFTQPEGTFNNYFCGTVYGSDASCTWNFATKDGSEGTVMVIFDNLQFAEEQWNGQSWGDNVIVYQDSDPIAYFNYGGAHDGKSSPAEQENGTALKNPEVVSISGDASILFESNNVGFTDGFSASYCIFTPTDERLCKTSSAFRDLTSSFDNHACGEFYQADANCNYKVEPDVTPGTMDIILYVTNADFSNGDTIIDFIEIYNSATLDKQFLIGGFNKTAEFYANEEEGFFPKTFIGTRDQMTVLFQSDSTGFAKGFDATYCTVQKPAATCGGGRTITASSDRFVDHICGPTYYRPMDCSWSFQPSSLNFDYIVLIFHSLDVGSGAYVEVHDPNSETIYRSDEHLNNIFDETQIVEGTAVFIPSTTASLRFVVSNAAILKSGWDVEYLTVVDTGICTGEAQYSEPQGNVQDHIYGNFYSSNRECSFLIQIPDATKITVRFEYFDLEEGFDFLEIYDGDGWNSELIGFLTGDEVPLPFTSSGNSLYFTFRTDESIVGRGFQIYYSDADLVDCPLFCSGFGECNNGVCECEDGHFGLGCEILDAPVARDAIFSDTLETITLDFDKETNRAGMFGSTSTDCSVILSPLTIAKLGIEPPRCVWRDNKTLLIRLGNQATITVGAKIEINGGLLQEANPTPEHPVTDAFLVSLLAPVAPEFPIVVIIGPTVLQNGRDLILDASASFISGGRNLRFYWSVTQVCVEGACHPAGIELGGYVSLQHGDELFISHNYFLDYQPNAVFHFSCVAENFLGLLSEPAIQIVQRSDIPVPVIVIAGAKHHTIKREEDILIRSYLQASSVEFEQIQEADGCPSITWNWSIECEDCATEQDYDYAEGLISNQSDIFIPADTLFHGLRYRVKLDAAYTEQENFEVLTSHEEIIVETEPFGIEIEVLGGIQTVTILNDVQLTAQLVEHQQHPDLISRTTYRWGCRKSSGYLCQKTNNDFLTIEESATVTIPAGSLPPGDYVFSVIGTYEDEHFISKDRDSVSVRILRREQPAVSILRNTGGKHDPRKPLVLNAQVTENVSFSWSVSAGDLVLDSTTMWSENAYGSELVIAPESMLDGATYRFMVNVVTTDGTINSAEIEIILNEAPSAGFLSVSPTFGFSVETKFTFSVTGASDDKLDMPLRYVFGVQPVTCTGTTLPNGNCPVIPISNQADYPRFSALLPPGDYYPIVDIFDRLGAYRRVRSLQTITAYDSCPATPNLMTEYIERVAVIARAYNCLGDSDAVRQMVNLASVTMSCSSFEIPEQAITIYFSDLEALLEQVDGNTPSTEIYVDNRVKSLLLSSALPLNGRGSDLSTLLTNSKLIAEAAQSKGFLRTDSAQSLLSGVSNIAGQNIDSADVAKIFRSLEGISGGLLRDRTCDTTFESLESGNINMRSQRQSRTSFAGSQVSSPSGSAVFTIPTDISSIPSCVNYIAVDFDSVSFNDGVSTVASSAVDLTLSDENNSKVSWSSSEPIEIQIPVTETHTEDLQCSSWNEATATWENNCEYVEQRDGFYIMRTTHLTSFAVLLSGTGGDSGGPPSISTFGSFATEFTAATEIFGTSNLDEFGNLVSSFDALDDIPTVAFATSNEVYDILQYSNSSDNLDAWTIDRILTLVSTGVALCCILLAIAILSLEPVRNYLSGKHDRTQRIRERKEARRKKELAALQDAESESLA